MLRLLRARAGATPLVIVVDDAQWGDDLSLRALSFAARRLAADPVLCVVAAGPAGWPGFLLAWSGRPPSVARGWRWLA